LHINVFRLSIQGEVSVPDQQTSEGAIQADEDLWNECPYGACEDNYETFPEEEHEDEEKDLEKFIDRYYDDEREFSDVSTVFGIMNLKRKDGEEDDEIQKRRK